ncbi:multiple C2 and transmembrane domain-containing protein 1-like isoform X8 [Scylla paramamosain]|uniref:multiple C2 and transmembrane domain-containing protein 1-like isoform X8 n=1 Tax=Scylla paramamosain TaxID=85552 RepID=UPI0030827759
MGGTFSRRGRDEAGAGEEEDEAKTELPKQNGTTPQSTELLNGTDQSATPTRTSHMFDDKQKNWKEDDALTPNVRALVGSPKRHPRAKPSRRAPPAGVGSSRENGHQGGAMRRSFSKSANDLLHRTRSPSGERSSEPSPKGSPTLGTRKAKEQDRPRANTQSRPAPSFFTTFKRVKKMAAEFRLKTKFQRTLSKESKVVARRKDVLLDGVRSNSHPDVSVERQDSTTDYAADNSSAEQSSSGTPLTMSPRRGPHLASGRHYSNDPNTLFENGEDPIETESRIMEELPGDLLVSTEASLDPDTSGAPGESGDQGASIASNFSPPTPARAAHFTNDTASPSPLLGRGTESDTSQQLMLCEGESVTVDAPSPLQASSSTNTTVCEVWSKEDPAVQRQRALRQHSFFQLHIHLKRGQDLVARDACGKLLPQYSSYQSGETTRAGTSDPYVKFKVAGKLAYKSKTVYKDLNPTWDESFTVGIEDPFEPVTVKVFDYDWGLQDDFMGLATIDLTTLDLDKCTAVELPLSEPRKASPPYMGKLYMSLTLQPKTQEEKEQVGEAFLSVPCARKNSNRHVYVSVLILFL